MTNDFRNPRFSIIEDEASRMFAAISNRDRNRWAYVYAPASDFVGMIENSLPGFWTQGLSKAYADNTSTNEIVNPRRMPLEEKKKKAKELYKSGWSYSQIARYFGVSKSTAYNWIHDYPYRK